MFHRTTRLASRPVRSSEIREGFTMREVKLKPPFDALQILIGIVVAGVCGAAAISIILFVVGETVEHFTP